MKYAIFTLILGYVMIFFSPQIEGYILPIISLILLIFMVYVFSSKIKGVQGAVNKILTASGVLLLTVLFIGIGYIAIESQFIDLYYIPVIAACLVLSRKLLKKIIDLSIDRTSGFGQMSETEKGETVRSKAEKKVADWLHENNYEYVYEKKIENGEDVIMTDFYLPQDEIYIEYWGMASADNDAGEKYRERKREKIELYDKYNLKLISLYPHHLYELDHYIPSEINRLTGRSIWQRLLGIFRSTEDTQAEPVTTEEPVETAFCTNCGNEGRLEEYCTNCGEMIS